MSQENQWAKELNSARKSEEGFCSQSNKNNLQSSNAKLTANISSQNCIKQYTTRMPRISVWLMRKCDSFRDMIRKNECTIWKCENENELFQNKGRIFRKGQCFNVIMRLKLHSSNYHFETPAMRKPCGIETIKITCPKQT